MRVATLLSIVTSSSKSTLLFSSIPMVEILPIAPAHFKVLVASSPPVLSGLSLRVLQRIALLNHRILPCGRQLSDPLWKDEEGLEVALEVARTGDSFPGMAGEGHSHHRSRSPCPSQLASVSGRDEEAPG